MIRQPHFVVFIQKICPHTFLQSKKQDPYIGSGMVDACPGSAKDRNFFCPKFQCQTKSHIGVCIIFDRIEPFDRNVGIFLKILVFRLASRIKVSDNVCGHDLVFATEDHSLICPDHVIPGLCPQKSKGKISLNFAPAYDHCPLHL